MLSRVWLFVASGLSPSRLLCPWNFPDKNVGVGCHFLLQGIFPTQESNSCFLHLLHWHAGSLPLAPPGKPKDFLLLLVAYISLTSDILSTNSQLQLSVVLVLFQTPLCVTHTYSIFFIQLLI